MANKCNSMDSFLFNVKDSFEKDLKNRVKKEMKKGAVSTRPKPELKLMRTHLNSRSSKNSFSDNLYQANSWNGSNNKNFIINVY